MAGVDGSSCGLDAARWAADDARRRGLPLRLVHVAVKELRERGGGRLDDAALGMLEDTAELISKSVPVAR